jgi:hypothetical protein
VCHGQYPVPVALKGIVDALDQPDVLVVLPLGLLFAYGVLRLSSSLFNELRDAVSRVLKSLALVWLLNPCIFKTFCRLLDSHQAK